MIRKLLSLVILYSISISVSPSAFAISPKNISEYIGRDIDLGVNQISLSKNEFWDLQLRTLYSPEAQAVVDQYRIVQGTQWSEAQILVAEELTH